MADDHIRYDVLAQEALRGVVRKVLTEVSKTGLPGEHHFFIGFDTRMPGVEISSRLREQYPEEMTIVMQHQFWDMSVSDTGFEIGLSFNGVPEKLVIPFAAVKSFLDPSVQFGLQFETLFVEDEGEDPVAADVDDIAHGDGGQSGGQVDMQLPVAASDNQAPEADTTGDEETVPSDDKDDTGDEETGSADVVSLDAFRKKN